MFDFIFFGIFIFNILVMCDFNLGRKNFYKFLIVYLFFVDLIIWNDLCIGDFVFNVFFE